MTYVLILILLDEDLIKVLNREDCTQHDSAPDEPQEHFPFLNSQMDRPAIWFPANMNITLPLSL